MTVSSIGEPDPLRVLRAMIERSSAEALQEVALLLHAKLHAPAHARERRVAELGFLAALLAEVPQPPEELPYIERQHYDERRAKDATQSPLSARLTERYTSWKRACYAAWTLLDDGRWTEGGFPWPASLPGKAQHPPYTRDEAIASIRLCRDALGRVPSSHAYERWRQNRISRARSRGQAIRLTSYLRIITLLAPNEPRRGRWKKACAVALR